MIVGREQLGFEQAARAGRSGQGSVGGSQLDGCVFTLKRALGLWTFTMRTYAVYGPSGPVKWQLNRPPVAAGMPDGHRRSTGRKPV